MDSVKGCITFKGNVMYLNKPLAVIASLVVGTMLTSASAQAASATIKCVIVNGSRVKVELEGEDLAPGSTYSGTIRNKSTLSKHFKDVEKPSDDFGHTKFKYDNELVQNKTIIPVGYAQLGHTIRGVIKFVAPGSGDESMVAAASTTCIAKTSGGNSGGGGNDGANHP
jgi:hypothetical protein